MLRSPIIQKREENDSISKSVFLDTSELPQLLSFIDPQLRLHAGFLAMLGIIVLIYWLLFHTTIGYEFRSTGANPNAAKYAGIKALLQ